MMPSLQFVFDSIAKADFPPSQTVIIELFVFGQIALISAIVSNIKLLHEDNPLRTAQKQHELI